MKTDTPKKPRAQAVPPVIRVHQALRSPHPELDGDDVAFLLAVAGWLGFGLKPSVVEKYEFRVALSSIQSLLKTGKSKVVVSRKKLEQLGIITLVEPGKQADHIPAKYRLNIECLETGVPTQNADTCMAGFQGETSRGSDVERRGVPHQDPAGFRRETVRRSLEPGESKEDHPQTTTTLPTNAPTPPTAPLSPHVVMIRDAILQDSDLARITPPDAIDAIVTDYAAAPIDALKTIRSAGDYLRTEPGRTIRNGVDHLRRRLQWAIDKAQKTTPPKPKRAMIDLSLHPELMPRPRV